MAEIKGLEKFAPKDFPGHISATIFLGGCNLRCPFCHNVELVLQPDSLPTFPEDYFRDFLVSRRGWLEGICITGGEPLLHEDLDELLRLIKEEGLLTKLDTNGSFPDRLNALIKQGLIDSVAMDVKAPLEKYSQATGGRSVPERIKESISLLRSSDVPCLFRTTVVPGLIGADDIEAIGRMLKGASRFQLQAFSPGKTLDVRFREIEPPGPAEMKALAEIARPFFEEVKIEGKTGNGT